MGLIDEYRLTAAEFKKVVGRDATAADADPRIGYTVPALMSAGHGDVEERHLKPFIDWLNARRREGEKPYRLVAGP